MPQEFPIDLISDAFRSTVIEFIHLTIFFLFSFYYKLRLKKRIDFCCEWQQHSTSICSGRRNSDYTAHDVAFSVSIWRTFEIKWIRTVTRHLDEIHLRKHRFSILFILFKDCYYRWRAKQRMLWWSSFILREWNKHKLTADAFVLPSSFSSERQMTMVTECALCTKPNWIEIARKYCICWSSHNHNQYSSAIAGANISWIELIIIYDFSRVHIVSPRIPLCLSYFIDIDKRWSEKRHENERHGASDVRASVRLCVCVCIQIRTNNY